MKIITVMAFLLLLGAAGGIERETIPFLPGAGLMAFALFVFVIGIYKTNRKEVHTMTPNEKKTQALRMLTEIDSPEEIARIYRFIYRQFLKAPVPAGKENAK